MSEVIEVDDGSPDTATQAGDEAAPGAPAEGAPPSGDASPPASAEGEPKPEGEKPPEAPKPPDKTAAEFAAAAKARQAKLREKRFREEQQQRSFAQKEADLRRREAAIAEYSQKIARLKDDPAAALELAGLDKEKFVESVMKRDSPEAKLAAELEAVKARLEAKEKADEEREQQVQREAVLRQQHQVRSQVTDFVVQHEDAFPNLTLEYSGQEIYDQIREVDEWALREGYSYSAEEVVNMLERRAEAARLAKEERRAKRAKVTPASGESETQSGAPSGQTTRTLNNKGASQKKSLPRDMTDEEKDAWALEELRKARKPKIA